MTDNIVTIGGIIVAVIGAITAFLVAVRPILTDILTELRSNRRELEKNTRVTEESHEMINGQREAALEQQTKTDNLLRAAGIPLPNNPAHVTQALGTEEPQ